MATRRVLRSSLPFGGASLLARRLTAALTLLLAVSALQCVQDFVSDPGQPEAAGQRRAQVIVTPAGATLMAGPQCAVLRATVLDEQGIVVLGRPVVWRSLIPRVAMVDSAAGRVCGSEAGQAIISATAAAAGDTAQVLVGYALITVTAPLATSVGSLARRTSGTTQTLTAVWGASADDVWAVGDSGTVVRYDGASWSRVGGVATGANLRAVWGASAEDVWVVGEGGTILRREGTGWTAERSGTTRTLTAVWGASPRDVYAVGEAGTIVRYDGASWSPVDSTGAEADLHAVWGTSADDVWAVGDAGTVVHYSGGRWRQADRPGTYAILTGIWGTAADELFVVAADGTVRRYDGAQWSVSARDTATSFAAIWGTSSREVYAGGSGGTVLRYDGASWTRVQGAGATTVRGLWGTSSWGLHAVGDAGAVLGASRLAGASLVIPEMRWRDIRASVATSLTVLVLDANGEVASGSTDSVTIALGPHPGGGVVYGTTTVLAQNGMARFTDLRFTHVGVGFTVIATAPGLSSTTSPAFSVVAGPLWGLTIAPLPPVVTAGRQFSVAVAGQDTFANRAPLPEGATVVLYLVRSPAGGGLFGGSRDTAVAGQVAGGVALFGGMLTRADTGVVLGIRGGLGMPAVQEAASATIAVVPGAATALVVEPAGVAMSAVGETQTLAVGALADEYGNPVPSPGGVTTWRSLNPAVATVDPATGVVRAVASGQTAVEAALGGLMAFPVATVAIGGLPPVRTWSAMSSGTEKDLFAVWAHSDTAVYAGGAGPTALRFNGVVWSPLTLGSPQYPEEVHAVSGSEPGGVWFASYVTYVIPGVGVGTVKSVWFPSGDGWSQTGCPGAAANATLPCGLWAVVPDRVTVTDDWAVKIYARTGLMRGQLLLATRLTYLFDAWGSSSRDLFAVGDEVWHWDGERATNQTPAGFGGRLFAVWGASPSEVFAVGQGGTILRYSGGVWARMASGTTQLLSDVWGTSGSDVYAVGANGTILHFDGGAWAPMASGTTRNLWGIFGVPSGEVFVVGAGGTILRGTR